MIYKAILALSLCFFSVPLWASYALSIGNYVQNEAESVCTKLSAHGYSAYVLYGRPSCEVRVGSFQSVKEALKSADKLKVEDKLVAAVVEEQEIDQAQFGWNANENGRSIDENAPGSYSDPKARKIVSLGLALFGRPYKYGGTSKTNGIDCSYFVQYIFKELGESLPRTAREQIKVGHEVDIPDLRVGDLVFFKKTYYLKKKDGKKAGSYTRVNHVGIFIGNGEFMHATTNVKHVTISRLNEKYFRERFAGARRVLK